jgi:leucyl-tRNA synthetase
MEHRHRPGQRQDRAGPLVERTIVTVTVAIEKLSFNVGLARLMELTPLATSPQAKRILVQLIAPFAPHLAQELWASSASPSASTPAPGQNPTQAS